MKKKSKKIMSVTAIMCAVAAMGFAFWPVKHAPQPDEADETESIKPAGPSFNADSAYAFTKAQCDFGPRNMNSKGHDECGNWIMAKFKSYGCLVSEQLADLQGYDGTVLHSRNIVARYRPEQTARIMLCAHWDSRPWADNDPDSANWRKPILAANDAASGVAVMLEVARLLQSTPLDIGVDFVCFDAEDWGTPQWSDRTDSEDTWALGANHFATHLPQGFAPRYGILLDMVGGQGAHFYREAISKQYAPNIVKKVWKAARQAGYASFFPNQDGGMITDDHIPMNQKAGIPTIDIIPYYPDCAQSSFGPTWHTVADNMDNISPATLKAVGQTVIQVLFTEE